LKSANHLIEQTFLGILVTVT